MYTIVLSIAVALALGVIACRLHNARFARRKAARLTLAEDRPWGMISWLMVSCIAGCMVGSIASGEIGKRIPRVPAEIVRLNLAAMRTIDSTHGVFVWGGGESSSSTTYRVLIATATGGYSPYEVDATNGSTMLFEDENLRDHGVLIERVYIRDENSFWYKWSTESSSERNVFFEFRVPKGSVMHSFDAR